MVTPDQTFGFARPYDLPSASTRSLVSMTRRDRSPTTHWQLADGPKAEDGSRKQTLEFAIRFLVELGAKV